MIADPVYENETIPRARRVRSFFELELELEPEPEPRTPNPEPNMNTN